MKPRPILTPLKLNGRGHKAPDKSNGRYGVDYFGKKCKKCKVMRPRVKGYCRECYYKGVIVKKGAKE